MRTILLLTAFCFFRFSGSAQVQRVDYLNDSLYINGTLLPPVFPSRGWMDGLMQTKSRTGILVGHKDPLSGEISRIKERAFLYDEQGLYFYQPLNNNQEARITIILDHEEDLLSEKAKQQFKAYPGKLTIGLTVFSTAVTFESIDSLKSISIIGSGETKKTKVPLLYKLGRYGQTLLLFEFRKTNGHLCTVTFMR